MSDIRFNRWLHQSGTGGISQDSTGNIGIGTTIPITALDVRGDVNIGDTININNASGIISATTLTATTGSFSGDISVTGNVSIAGTLTYEDVSNIDAVGIITAQSDIIVGGGLTVTGISTFNNDVKLLDNDKLKFGIGEDLDLYHDATDTYLRNQTGQFLIRGNDIKLQSYLGETYVTLANNNAVSLYYDNSKKFETTSTGSVVTGILTATSSITGSNYEIAGISSSISDTAVDVFVYDTRKDSDGGQWRKRTQNTSWYNEALGTATRGSRKEFPAVAVIVAETTQLTIYDGDDPDLPMWMVFNSGDAGAYTGPHINIASPAILTAVAALNGEIVITCDSTGSYPFGSLQINFLKDRSLIRPDSGGKESLTGIAKRNETGSYSTTYTYPALVNMFANDVAMTVLPNAPIDDATGLPIPTIAVATDGGVSIIKDDGTVVDMYPNDAGERPALQIGFTKSNKLVFRHNFNWVYYYEIPNSDLNAAYWNGLSGYIGRFTSIDRDWDTNYKGIPVNAPSNTDITEFLEDRALGHINGLDIIDINSGGLLGYGMHAGISKDFNTGYQHGDIKGAFLSDTDTTNVTGSELITNTDFASDLSGWTNGNPSQYTRVTNNVGGDTDGKLMYYATDNNFRTFTQFVTCVAGERYVLSLRACSDTASAMKIDIDGTDVITIDDNNNAAFITKQHTFTAGSTSVRIRIESAAANRSYFTDFSVRLAEEDRSVNDNGLQVFGTITKSPVATGADLVGYGPFTTANRLRQPYNSDLNFETNDFSVMLWMYNTGSTVHQTLVGRDNREFSVDILDNANYDRKFRVYAFDSSNSMGSFDSNADPFPLNTWTHVCVNYTNGNTAALYVNGVLNKSETLNYDIDDTSNGLNIGCRNTSGSYAHAADATKLTLVRISKSAPSPEQIKKIYEDEKVLFQENAKATLYGSSDAVTALAYDDTTNLLHVGTSAGRSEFQGLRRINNTTDAVTTAISASNGLVAEQ